jgi:prepilin-type N-terminal cleavage/methylation domain-containing protein
MRATSVRYLRNPEADLPRGFSLLELLVVMALMSLLAGLVSPALQRGFVAAQERAVSGDMTAVLGGLSVRAFQQGTDLTVDDGLLKQLLPDLPTGWRIVVPKVLRYNATGVAMGGQVRVLTPGRAPMVWKVEPLSGRVVRSTNAGEQ